MKTTNNTKLHRDLDRAVEKCYRAGGKAFTSDEERITMLFALYERYTAPLTAEASALAERAAGKKRRKEI